MPRKFGAIWYFIRWSSSSSQAGDANSTQQELGRGPRTGSVKQPEINAPQTCMVCDVHGCGYTFQAIHACHGIWLPHWVGGWVVVDEVLHGHCGAVGSFTDLLYCLDRADARLLGLWRRGGGGRRVITVHNTGRGTLTLRGRDKNKLHVHVVKFYLRIAVYLT